jgi:hypothetical protein
MRIVAQTDGRTDKHDEVKSLLSILRMRLTYPTILILYVLLAFFNATQNSAIRYKKSSNRTGDFMHHQVQHSKILHSVYEIYFRVLNGYQGKEQCLYKALTYWFYNQVDMCLQCGTT